jgi:ribosomal protein L39E
MNEFVTVNDVLESAKKYGEDSVLTWDPAVYRDNMQNNKNKGKKVNDCTWLPFKFKNAAGKEMPLKLKFLKIVSSSSAKLPESKDGDVKNMNILFREVTFEEVSSSGYEDDSKKLVDELVQNTNDFAKVISIINKSFNKICVDLKSAKSLGFTIRKNKTIKTNNDIPIWNILQTTREDKDSADPDAEPIQLEFPLYRAKLCIGDGGLIGIKKWNNNAKAMEFKQNVYDVRKMNQKNNFTPVLAAIKVNGNVSSLDKDNAGMFITYRSIVNGFIEFKNLTISKFGISLDHHFGDIYVKRNKSQLVEQTLSKEDLAAIGGDDDSEEDDVEINTSAGPSSSKSKIGVNMEIDDLVDDVSDGSDLEDGCSDSS